MTWYCDVATRHFDNAQLFGAVRPLIQTKVSANPTVMPAETVSINPIIKVCYYLSSVLVFSQCYDTLVQRLH